MPNWRYVVSVQHSAHFIGYFVSDSLLAHSGKLINIQPINENVYEASSNLDRNQVRFSSCFADYSLHVILCRSLGIFEVELYWNEAPRTCQNFVELSRRGYYNNTKFHRIIPDFMIQGIPLVVIVNI